jgi:replicative DNA helicase
LDDLRGRYGFALILEHHAPHGPAKDRQMRPFGSSLWLRWPEFGIALRRDPNDKTALNVGRWRGDRVKASWPDRLVRGKTWPWNGRWDDDL